MKAGPTGVLNVLKPPGMTSHDVVNQVRRLARTRRVGHTGTLDPLAAGVLVLVIGRATRASQYFSQLDKDYRVEAMFGIRTSSGDADGQVLDTQPAGHLAPGDAAAAAQEFTGWITQVPPATSAIKVGGRPLYKLAHRGKDVQAPPRRVRVDKFELLSWQEGDRPRAFFDITCSSGTYVRSLVDDLGQRLQVGATVSFLLRTRVGPFQVGDALTLEELAEDGAIDANLVPLEQALAFLPSITIPAQLAAAVAHGRPLPVPAAGSPEVESPFRLLDETGRLLAVARLGTRGKDRPTIKYDFVLVRPEDFA